MPICEKGVSAKAWIDFWCKKVVHNPLTQCHCRGLSLTRMQNPNSQIRHQDLCWSRDELEVFRSIGVPEEKRVHILPHFCHVGCALLYFLRSRGSSFAHELLRLPAWWHLVPLSAWQSLCYQASTVTLMGLLKLQNLLTHGHSFPATNFADGLPTISRLTMYCSIPLREGSGHHGESWNSEQSIREGSGREKIILNEKASQP